jgi:hypothetical protein
MQTLAKIPEDEIWLAMQKSARTRRAYRLDVQHFMRTLAIATSDELRQVDHRAVIAWERTMRETEHTAPSTIRRRLSALSSLFAHLCVTALRRRTRCARSRGRPSTATKARPWRFQNLRHAGYSTRRPRTPLRDCATAPFCRSVFRWVCAAARSQPSPLEICTKTVVSIP